MMIIKLCRGYIPVPGGRYTAIVNILMVVIDAKHPVVEGILTLGINVGKAIRILTEKSLVITVINILSR